MQQKKWTVQAADAYLNEIPKFTSEKHTEEGLRRMLSHLGAMPERQKVIHVAGTNGKGSVCSFLDAILQSAGKKTARFTSPHLVRVTERFSFEGREVDDALFLEAFEAVRASYVYFEQEGLGRPTYFEYLFLMFMWMVKQKQPEYVILETGLGGRLDATNCLETPVLTVITSISLDHMEYLGNTVEQIAGEKAGILKPKIPVVYDDTDASASAVIRARAEELSCPAYPVSPSVYTGLQREKGGIHIRLKGEISLFIPFEAEYQAVNACLAFQSARLLAVDAKTAAAGIRTAVWRGRMEAVQEGVYLDGAHNEGGIRAFAEAAVAIAAERNRNSGKKGRIFLLFAAVSDKNYESMLEILMQKLKPDRLILTHLMTQRSLSLKAMEEAARRVSASGAKAALESRKAGEENGGAKERETDGKHLFSGKCNIQCVADVRAAYEQLLMEKQPEDTCFCVGSLYLIGELEKERI